MHVLNILMYSVCTGDWLFLIPSECTEAENILLKRALANKTMTSHSLQVAGGAAPSLLLCKHNTSDKAHLYLHL